tara:strand:+ start:51 stop:479 length:429 start_codon:yes stop_codon:yes gene_type:complete
MKIEYYSKTEDVAEKIRKKANLIYVLLPIGYDKETVEDALNCEVNFKGKDGEKNIFMVNNKIVFLGGLGYKQHISNEKIKRVLESFSEMEPYMDSKNVLMIYPSDEILMKYIDSIENIVHELNIIYKHKTKKNLYRYVFIAK